MVTDPLLLLGALLLVIVLAILIRRMPKKQTPEILAEVSVPEILEVVDVPSPFLDAADGPADDLGRIKGIGPKIAARLQELGVFHYRQIAAWTPGQLAVVDLQLGNFQGRPERDQWQAQARLLADGDLKAFERTHGKLGPKPDSDGQA